MEYRNAELHTETAAHMESHLLDGSEATVGIEWFTSLDSSDAKPYEPTPSLTDDMRSPVTLRGDTLVW